VPVDAVHREGITSITAQDIDAARNAGYVIKLLAIAERITDSETGVEGISARVYPALISREHPLAAVHEGKNAVFVEAEAAGSLMFYGAGAGGKETASAVMGDLVSAARRHVVGGPGIPGSTHAELEILPIERVLTQYQIMLEVNDQPGVLAAVASVLNNHGVSVARLEQSVPKDAHGTATLIIGTHTAREEALAATVQALAESDAVSAVTSVLRVEGN
jgi:homoserine dehydrogenase